MLKYSPERFSNLMTDIYLKDITGVNIAKDHEISEGRISQLKKQIKNLKYPPRIEDKRVVCYKCGSPDWLGFHRDHYEKITFAILCQSCTVRIGSDELAYQSEPKEWKEGFKELYTLFEDVINNINIIRQKKLWNALVQKRNLGLIDKLAGELNG